MNIEDPQLVALVVEAMRRVVGWTPPSPAKAHDLYLFGLRNASSAVGPWDDARGALEGLADGRYRLWLWRATTNPGVEQGMNDDGVACLVPGRYPACWTLGLHKGDKHRPAFVQAAPRVFRVWRDRREDGSFPRTGQIYAGASGLNAHGPGPGKVAGDKVGRYSEGCQVAKSEADHLEAVALGRAQVAAGHGSSFSYVLLDLRDAPELGRLLGFVGVV